MIDTILIFLGIAIMIFSSYICIRLIKLIEIKQLKIAWYFLFVLILFFLVGYISYLYFINELIKNLDLIKNLISIILCFGGVFVLLVLIVNYKLLLELRKEKQLLEAINRDLVQKTDDIKKNKKAKK